MSPLKRNKLNKIRKKLDKLDDSLIKIIKKRTLLVKKVLSLKEKKSEIIDHKRINKILKHIKSVNWSSSETTLPKETAKSDFDKYPVLDRFAHQLNASGVTVRHTLKPDFRWACANIDNIKKKYELNNYIILFPFCSTHLSHKKWPYYNELINLIKKKHGEKIKIVISPGPSEIQEAKNIDALCVLDGDNSLNISQLATLIKDSMFVVANDTGPAHMSAHLGSTGITLFGHHTTPYKVSIETDNFKAIVSKQLEKLSADFIYEKISKTISLP